MPAKNDKAKALMKKKSMQKPDKESMKEDMMEGGKEEPGEMCQKHKMMMSKCGCK